MFFQAPAGAPTWDYVYYLPVFTVSLPKGALQVCNDSPHEHDEENTDSMASRCEMSTTTATEPSAGFDSGADTRPFVMPETMSGFRNKIIEAAPGTNPKFAERVARRLKARMDRMNTVEDFYEALRILGMTTDTTARDAAGNIERNAR